MKSSSGLWRRIFDPTTLGSGDSPFEVFLPEPSACRRRGSDSGRRTGSSDRGDHVRAGDRRRAATRDLRLVLEPYAAAVPGFFLYFPSRAQVSPALRAFVDVARALAGQSNRHAS